jgi:large subunit ribosomal protein L4
MKANKYDVTGKAIGQVELPAAIFTDEYSKGSIYTVIRIENRNRRQGTHKTKGFSEVSGGGKKPWRQKGTGNARQGSIRAPQWRKGYTVFGPQPRDYSLRIPEKVRKHGMRSILSARATVNAVSVLENIKMEKFSTSTMFKIFKTMGVLPGNTVCFVSDSEDLKIKKSLMNIPGLVYVNAKRLTAPEVYYSGHLIVTEGAMKHLENTLAKDTASKAGVA